LKLASLDRCSQSWRMSRTFSLSRLLTPRNPHMLHTAEKTQMFRATTWRPASVTSSLWAGWRTLQHTTLQSRCSRIKSLTSQNLQPNRLYKSSETQTSMSRLSETLKASLMRQQLESKAQNQNTSLSWAL
jgi:hypothetical protein